MYKELEPLANLKIGKAVDKLARENSERLVRIQTEHAARGLVRSGMLDMAKLKSRLQLVKGICEEVSRVWIELIRLEDGRLTPESVNFIKKKVSEWVQGQRGGLQQASQNDRSMAPASMNATIESELSSIESTIGRDLEIERREEKLREKTRPPGQRSEQVFVVMASTADLLIGA
jgi:hypothetical protein